MNKFKRNFLVICIFVCMLVVAGCGKKKDNDNTFDKNTVFREEEIKLPMSGNYYIENMVTSGDNMFFVYYTYDDNTYETHYYLGSSKVDFSNFKETEIEFDGGWMQNFLADDKGNAYIILNKWIYDEDEGFFEDEGTGEDEIVTYEDKVVMDDIWIPRGQNKNYVIKYDSNLNLISNIDLSESGFDYMNNFCYVGNDQFLINDGSNFYLLDSEMKVTKKVETNKDVSNMYTIRDGSVVVQCWTDKGMGLYKLDKNSLTLADEEIKIPGLSSNMSYSKGTKTDFIIMDRYQVYTYNIGDAEIKPVMNYLNSDIGTSYFNTLIQADDNTFYGLYSDWDADYSVMCYSRYTKVAPEDVVEKKVITLGCIYIDNDVRRKVISFNKTNPDYRITVIDYSDFNTEEDWTGGYTKMNTDIAAGKCPDILVSNGSALVMDYASKGLFVDLYKYMDKDSEVKKDKYFANLLDAFTYNGKLIALVPNFSIQTLLAKTSLVGSKPGMTFDEMLALEKNLSQGGSLFYGVGRSSFLMDYLDVNASAFIDNAAGKCYFDSEEFIKLLEFAKKLPEKDGFGDYEDFDYEKYNQRFRSNIAIFDVFNLYSIRNLKYEEKGVFGEDVTFVGYPTNSGNGSALCYDVAYSISSKCKAPEVAWDFIRYFMTDEYMNKNEYGIPASVKRFDELAKEAQKRMSYEYEGETYYMDDYYYIGNESIVLEELNDADIAKIKDLVSSTTKVRGSVSSVLTIIEEETQAFFEGQKTAEDVAKIIQSRVTIYINERL